MHEAKEVDLIDPLRHFKTDISSRLGDCLRIKLLLHKIRPPFCKSVAERLPNFMQQVEHICIGIYIASSTWPSPP